MTSNRDAAFEACYEDLDGIISADPETRRLFRMAWDAGRLYEIQRQRAIKQKTKKPSRNDTCDGCGSPADYVRLRGRVEGDSF